MIIKRVLKMTHTQKRNPSNQYITIQQRVELIKEVGDSAALLFHHYFDKSGSDQYDYKDDKKTAAALGWNVRKVARERYKLENTNWILRKTFSHRVDGSKYQITIVGKSAVLEHQNKLVHEENTINTEEG